MQPDSAKGEEVEPTVPQRVGLAAPVASSVWTGAARAVEARPADATSKVKTEANEPSLASAGAAVPSTYLPTPPPATTDGAASAVGSRVQPVLQGQQTFAPRSGSGAHGARVSAGGSERITAPAGFQEVSGVAGISRPVEPQSASTTTPLTDANFSRLVSATAAQQLGEHAVEEDAKSNADSLSSASSSIAERAPVASSSKPQDVGLWTAETASPAMKRLVRKRTEIFEAQRGAREHPLQATSQERIESTFAQHLATQGPYLSGFRNYIAFCDRCNIPPFPLTYTSMALWLYDKCSLSDGHFHTYKHGLLLAADVVRASWKSERVYKELSRFDSGGLALSEFFEERRLMYQKAPAKRASPKKAPQRRKLPKRPPSSGSDSSSSASASNAQEESDYLEDDSEEEGESGDRSIELTSSRDVPVPGLPKANDVFATETDLYKACVAALVPVYGVSVILAATTPTTVTLKCNRSHPHWSQAPGGTCGWTCVARREILANPAWRPKVRNPHAREVLGMPPLATSTSKRKAARKTKEPSASSDEAPLQKKPRLSLQSAALPTPTGSQTLAKSASQTQVTPRETEFYMAPPPVPAFDFGRPPASSRAPLSLAPVPHVQPPARPPFPQPSSKAPPILQARLSDDPEKLVAAFCAGLYPSLDALAKPLVSIGIDSIEAISSLRSLDASILSRLFDTMRQQWTARRANEPSLPPLSLVHLNLFAKFVKA
ncbi:hypothetical protein BMF94_0323 [Rhodotorula taiwanensis]|uniref:Uncharacterized protein n=1 Tax=Rhodotorula taiwanensis TaxID=741276 RepID=A0A2S5BIX7_9BASI|nr:hypothetical protein BMF94_0323 [Rhodotorula taiwanensis]